MGGAKRMNNVAVIYLFNKNHDIVLLEPECRNSKLNKCRSHIITVSLYNEQ